MIKFTIKSQSATPILNRLAEAYRETTLPFDSSYEQNREEAARLVPLLSKDLKDGFTKHPPEISPDIFGGIKNREDTFKVFLGFSNYSKAVYDLITGNSPEFTDMQPLERKRLPDLKAFELVGMNNVRISGKPGNVLIPY